MNADRSGIMFSPLDATSRDRVERTPLAGRPIQGSPHPRNSRHQRLFVVLNLTLTPHHSITPTNPTSLSVHDLRFLHDWHQRSHDEATRPDQTDHPSTNAGFPAGRRDPA